MVSRARRPTGHVGTSSAKPAGSTPTFPPREKMIRGTEDFLRKDAHKETKGWVFGNVADFERKV